MIFFSKRFFSVSSRVPGVGLRATAAEHTHAHVHAAMAKHATIKHDNPEKYYELQDQLGEGYTLQPPRVSLARSRFLTRRVSVCASVLAAAYPARTARYGAPSRRAPTRRSLSSAFLSMMTSTISTKRWTS